MKNKSPRRSLTYGRVCCRISLYFTAFILLSAFTNPLQWSILSRPCGEDAVFLQVRSASRSTVYYRQTHLSPRNHAALLKLPWLHCGLTSQPFDPLLNTLRLWGTIRCRQIFKAVPHGALFNISCHVRDLQCLGNVIASFPRFVLMMQFGPENDQKKKKRLLSHLICTQVISIQLLMQLVQSAQLSLRR